MPDSCWDKVEDQIAAVLTPLTATGQTLAGWTVLTEQSVDVAIETDQQAISIWTVAITIDQADDLHSSMHTQLIELEFTSGNAPAGTLGRLNKTAMALAHPAIAADRSLGGMVLDIQEVDIAPARVEGRDTNGTSLQYRVEFFTPRDDWLTILGQAGENF